MDNIVLAIAYALNIIDYLFTRHWVNLYGISVEGNPFGRWLFENNLAGAFKIFVVGALFAVLGYLLNQKPKFAWVAFIPLVAYALIVIYHIVICFLIKF